VKPDFRKDYVSHSLKWSTGYESCSLLEQDGRWWLDISDDYGPHYFSVSSRLAHHILDEASNGAPAPCP
jgi:hypothetical protein